MAPVQWNAEALRDLHRRKAAFPLDADIASRTSGSTLSVETLQFLGMLLLWKRPQHIFAFGCGLSTLFIERILHRPAGLTESSIVSIDHSQRYLAETRRALESDQRVSLLHAPLAVTELFGRVFTTYHPDYTQNIQPGVCFDFVLIDGPPAFRYGREAPLYHLAPWLAPEAVLVLNDANREPEQEALRNWKSVWTDRISIELFPDLNKGVAVLGIGDALHTMDRSAHHDQTGAVVELVSSLTGVGRPPEGGSLATGVDR